MRVTVLHTQAPARTALRERLHRVGRMQNVQLRAQVTFARDGQIIPGCFEIQDTRARCTQILVLTRSAARTVTHVQVSACAQHADSVHGGKTAKSSCVLMRLRSHHARFAAAR